MIESESVPEWATHIATSTTNGRKEYCVWNKEANDYLDEDPAALKNGDWAGGYNHAYWQFELINQG